MTVRNALTQLKAKSLDKGKHADGQGLWLVKSRRDGGTWMLRLVVSGKRREMGLGRWPDVSIAEARERAEIARRRLRDGVDPVEERQHQRTRAHCPTLAEAINGCFAAPQPPQTHVVINATRLATHLRHVGSFTSLAPISAANQEASRAISK